MTLLEVGIRSLKCSGKIRWYVSVLEVDNRLYKEAAETVLKGKSIKELETDDINVEHCTDHTYPPGHADNMHYGNFLLSHSYIPSAAWDLNQMLEACSQLERRLQKG